MTIDQQGKGFIRILRTSHGLSRPRARPATPVATPLSLGPSYFSVPQGGF